MDFYLGVLTVEAASPTGEISKKDKTEVYYFWYYKQGSNNFLWHER